MNEELAERSLKQMNLKSSEKHILFILSLLANENNECNITIKELQNYTNLGKNTIPKKIKLLINKKIISKNKDIYFIHFPELENTYEQETKQTLINQRRSQFGNRRAQLMLLLIERDGYICKLCAIDKNITIDHVIPISKGGTDDSSNLQLLCQSCNSKKGINC